MNEPKIHPLSVTAATATSQVLDAVVSFLRRYLVMSDAQFAATTLWIAHTHAFEAADFTPYLAILSAEKRCGKTTLLDCLSLLAANPFKSGSFTTASVKRLAANRPTLLLDEIDTVFKPGQQDGAEALRGLLNDGFYAGGRSTFCNTDRNNAVETIPAFSPKAFAGIGNYLPSTVLDRSILIRLKRRRRDETVERFRLRRVTAEATQVTSLLTAWAVQAIPELTFATPDSPPDLGDRAADIWEPLFAIADLAGGEWPLQARRIAVELASEAEDEDDSIGIALLADIRSLLGSEDRIRSSELVERLSKIEGAPWYGYSKWWRGEWGATALATLLRPYDIKPTTIRVGPNTPNGYWTVAFKDAFDRLLPPTTVNTPNTLNAATDDVGEVDPVGPAETVRDPSF